MEIYQTAKFERSPNNLSWDIVLTDRWPEQKKKKRRRKAKAIDLHLHADLTRATYIKITLLQGKRIKNINYTYRIHHGHTIVLPDILGPRLMLHMLMAVTNYVIYAR